MGRKAKRVLSVVLDGLVSFTLYSAYYWLETKNLTASIILQGLTFSVFLVGSLFVLKIYRAILSHINPEFFIELAKALAVSIAATIAVGHYLGSPVTAFDTLIVASLTFSALAILRVVAQQLIRRHSRWPIQKKVAIYGAGKAGLQVASALMRSIEYQPVIFLDDSKELQGRSILGIPILRPDKIEHYIVRYRIDEILLAIPSATADERRAILDQLQKVAIRVKSLPSIEDIVIGRISVDQIDDVSVEDLLGREPIPSIHNEIRSAISNKVVLVTGAGGSIGSELSRQICRYAPKSIILLDLSESSLYQIEQALLRGARKNNSHIVPILGNIQDESLIRTVLTKYKVELIFHAAAYKHVPLVESNPFEALRNNVFGTLSVAAAARDNNVTSLVLISTDKAVRPTNVMGASKRLSEMVVQSFAAEEGEKGKTKFCMVRFGNVLDSSGSVLPLFRKQVKNGGPVTVTHPEVTRYFMTIPEAVHLVLQASLVAENGDVCVLDMGSPVKILDLARKIIRLAGYTIRGENNTDVGIAIEFIGLRPGEKLHEELLIGKHFCATAHPKVIRASEVFLAWKEFDCILRELKAALDQRNKDLVENILVRAVHGYVPFRDKFKEGSV